MVAFISFVSTMPKIKESTSSRLDGCINELGRYVFTTDGTILLCKICKIKVKTEKKFPFSKIFQKKKQINWLKVKVMKKN